LVDPSPWPLVASLGAFMFTVGTVSYMHKFIGGWNLLITGFSIILYVMFTWWRDIIRATFEDTHTITVQKFKIRYEFICISVMFSLFLGIFHSSVAPVRSWSVAKLLVQLTHTLFH
jgi:cytochrome c oxidase subunit 3